MKELAEITDRDLFGWNKQLYGNTKFDDLPIAIAWIRCRFHQSDAAKMVGYASIDKKGNQGGAVSITFRLIRFNTKNPLILAEALIKTGHITREDITGCLKESLYRKGSISMAAVWWGRSICKSALRKYKSKGMAASALGIEIYELNDWISR